MIKIIEKAYKTMNFLENIPEEDLKTRGFWDPHTKKLDTRLPNKYYYPRDSIALWDTILDYVTKVLALFYINQESISQDFELQVNFFFFFFFAE